jgi:DNA primase
MSVCQWTVTDMVSDETTSTEQEVAAGQGLGGDTLVVTRGGIRPIRELAGSERPLLIPHYSDRCRGGEGRFLKVRVRSLGIQQLVRVALRRCRQKTFVDAAPGQTWFVVGAKEGGRPPAGRRHPRFYPVTEERTVAELVPGDRVRGVRAAGPRRPVRVAFAVAQGFVFGDGTKGTHERPATLNFYNADKDGALLRYFAAHDIRDTPRGKRIYGLPRTWKTVPDIVESRSFLVSWLAGYFAADGSVTKAGQAVLYSAVRDNILFARDVMAVCGIRHGAVLSRTRTGFGVARELHSINLDTRDVPDWFFVIDEHRLRVEGRPSGEGQDREWVVESVEECGAGEVFGAVVPGAGAIGLADGLLTGGV